MTVSHLGVKIDQDKVRYISNVDAECFFHKFISDDESQSCENEIFVFFTTLTNAMKKRRRYSIIQSLNLFADINEKESDASCGN